MSIYSIVFSYSTSWKKIHQDNFVDNSIRMLYEVIKTVWWPCFSKYMLPFSRPLDALSLGDFHNSPHQRRNSFIHSSCVKVYSHDIYQDNTQTFTAEMLMFKGYLSTLAYIRYLFNWMIWFTLSKCPQLHAIDALLRCKSVFYTR